MRWTRDNYIANSLANMEPIISNAPLGEKKMQRFDTPVCIVIHSYRRRLADPDGISAKAAIDGIVKARILTDDTTKQIKEVRFKQTKIKAPEEEKTEIIIYEINKKIRHKTRL